MHPDHRATGPSDQLDETGGLEDLGLPVPGQVIAQRLHLAVLLPSGHLTQPDRGDLGIAVGDPRNLPIGHRGGPGLVAGPARARSPRRRRCRARSHGVPAAAPGPGRPRRTPRAPWSGAARRPTRNRGPEETPASAVSEALGRRPSPDRDQQDVGLEHRSSARVTDTRSSLTSAVLERGPGSRRDARLRKARSRPAETSGSSVATSRGSASTTVTSTPKERQADANSTPITPPPRTTARRGSVVRRSACSLVSTRCPSISNPGSVFAYEPVASTTCAPGTRSVADPDDRGFRRPPRAAPRRR